MHFSCSCRRQNIISMVLRLPLKPHCVSGTTSGVMWVDSLLRRILAKILPAMERREITLYVAQSVRSPFLYLVTMLATFHACCTNPTSQALVISWCNLLNRLSPPCFHTSAGIPSPPGALPSLRLSIVLTISSTVGISSRLVLIMRCGMLSRAM